MITQTIRRFLSVLILTLGLQAAYSGGTFFGIPVEDTTGGIIITEETPGKATPTPTPQTPAEPKTSYQPPVATSFSKPSPSGPRILILADVSMSVTGKAAGTPIEKEVLKIIRNLPDNASIGVIQFARSYKIFQEEMVPLTPKNRELVGRWINREWVNSGKMPDSPSVISNPRAVIGVLEVAAGMKPDIIYLISDGSFQWSSRGKDENVPWDDLSSAVTAVTNGGKPAVLNFIAVQTASKDRGKMAEIVQRSGGKMTQIGGR